jgi:hypothetical protein
MTHLMSLNCPETVDHLWPGFRIKTLRGHQPRSLLSLQIQVQTNAPLFSCLLKFFLSLSDILCGVVLIFVVRFKLSS